MAREGVISRADCISRKLRESRIVKYRTRPRFLFPFLLSREIIFDFSSIEQESPCEIDDSPVRIMRTILSTMFLRNTCLLLLLLPSRDITSEINWRKPAANSVNGIPLQTATRVYIYSKINEIWEELREK